MRPTHTNGLIGILLLIILAALTISYFKIDVNSVVQKPETQAGIEFAKTQATSFWDSHLKQPLQDMWKAVFIDVVWKSFVDSMKQNANNLINPPQTTPPTTVPATP